MAKKYYSSLPHKEACNRSSYIPLEPGTEAELRKKYYQGFSYLIKHINTIVSLVLFNNNLSSSIRNYTTNNYITSSRNAHPGKTITLVKTCQIIYRKIN